MLRESVYPYGYMDDWKKFDEISLPEKGYFYRHLNMVCIDFKINSLGEYHHLYVQIDTLLLSDAFDNF